MARNILSHSSTHCFDRAFLEMLRLNTDLMSPQEHLFVLLTRNVSMLQREKFKIDIRPQLYECLLYNAKSVYAPLVMVERINPDKRLKAKMFSLPIRSFPLKYPVNPKAVRSFNFTRETWV